MPTLYHLLGPVSERPAIFHVMAADRFDRTRVGQVLYLDPADGRLGEAELLRRFGNDRDWFNVTRPGAGNGGHNVWPRIGTDDEPARADRVPQDVVMGPESAPDVSPAGPPFAESPSSGTSS